MCGTQTSLGKPVCPCKHTHTHACAGGGEPEEGLVTGGFLEAGTMSHTSTPRSICSRGHFRGWVEGGGMAQSLHSRAPPVPCPFPLLTSLIASRARRRISLSYSLEGKPNPTSSLPLTDVLGPGPHPVLVQEPQGLLDILSNTHIPPTCWKGGPGREGFPLPGSLGPRIAELCFGTQPQFHLALTAPPMAGLSLSPQRAGSTQQLPQGLPARARPGL